ncbi:hypothetical protein BC937DRAFT_93088 [Endogone sp. FLAS-F59071]|nr:hypothetical protein BC937DRAFT_93088 [Endogone sp. FLAS-F59071]|eukprot:RUS21306.1 hypothetical protein BC937DRAFT_93088 [Endogone sp. FLAS-F59071]
MIILTSLHPPIAFFISLRKDFEAERPKIREEDYSRFFYLIHFFLRYQRLALERIRGESAKKFTIPGDADVDVADTCDFDLVAGVMEVRGFLLCLKRMKMAYEDKVGRVCVCVCFFFFFFKKKKCLNYMFKFGMAYCWDHSQIWSELHVAVDCFKQMVSIIVDVFHRLASRRPSESFSELAFIMLLPFSIIQLLTLEAMAQSPHEDYRDVSENLQNNVFYEESTLDLVMRLVRDYKYQSIGFLGSAIELVHVLLKMLERYSKSKRFMFVRKKKAAPRKNKASVEEQPDGSTETSRLNEEITAAEPEEQEEEEEEEDPEAKQERKAAYAEHVFQLEKFELVGVFILSRWV